MKRISTYIVVVLIILLYSCKPEPIDIKIEKAQTKLVVNGMVSQMGILVSLTRTIPPQVIPADASGKAELYKKLAVDSGLVIISYDNKKDTLMMVSPGYYVLDTLSSSASSFYNLTDKELKNKTFYFYAKDYKTGLEVTSSSKYIPYVICTSTPIKEPSNNDTLVYAKVKLWDEKNVNNWYFITYTNYADLYDTNSTRKTDELFEEYFTDNNDNFNKYFLFSDDSFKDTTFEKTFLLKNITTMDTLTAIIIGNIDEGYFKFLSASEASSNYLNTLTGEPINFPTNINNGIGYFNAYTPVIFSALYDSTTVGKKNKFKKIIFKDQFKKRQQMLMKKIYKFY